MEEIQEEQVQEEKKKKSVGFDVQDKIERAEDFFDGNSKQITIVVIVLVVIAGLFAAYKLWYMPGQEESAQKDAFYSALEFERDSLTQAVKGGTQIRTSDGVSKKTMGLEKIVEEYGSTKAGKLATYELGCVYMRQGKYEAAIEKFNDFDGDDIIVSAIAIGATGDCYMELNKPEEAIKYYLKAADKNSNSFSSPIYLKKAGVAYESQKKYAEALKMYERIQREFGKLPNGQETAEAKDIKKYIAKVKALGKL